MPDSEGSLTIAVILQDRYLVKDILGIGGFVPMPQLVPNIFRQYFVGFALGK